jgi:hypothetical protein
VEQSASGSAPGRNYDDLSGARGAGSAVGDAWMPARPDASDSMVGDAVIVNG